MADLKLSQQTAAGGLTGTELAYVVQGGNSRRTTLAAIVALASGTNLTYDPATRLLSSSTGADVTLPLATDALDGLQSAAHRALVQALIAAGVTAAGSTVTIPHIHGDIAGSLYVHIKNTSGGTLVKGTFLRITGQVGDTPVLEVAAADPASAATMPAFGVLAETIGNNDPGHAVVAGELLGLNTAGLTQGTILYVAAGGGWTAIRPTSGVIQQMAIVGRVHASTGGVTVTVGSLQSPNWDIDVTLAASVADVLSLSGQELQADDPGGDRLLFWDDSEGKLRYLSLGTGLSITGTTIDAATSAVTYSQHNTLTASANAYTLDATAFNEFTASAAIAGNITITCSNLSSVPSGQVWRAVFRFSYTSGAITLAAPAGVTAKGSVGTLTAGQTYDLVVRFIGGGTIVDYRLGGGFTT